MEARLPVRRPERVAQVKMAPRPHLDQSLRLVAVAVGALILITKVETVVQGVEQVSGFREAALQRLAVP